MSSESVANARTKSKKPHKVATKEPAGAMGSALEQYRWENNAVSTVPNPRGKTVACQWMGRQQ